MYQRTCQFAPTSSHPLRLPGGAGRAQLLVVLRHDLELVGRTLKTSADLEELRSIAQNRAAWSYLVLGLDPAHGQNGHENVNTL